MNVDRDTYYNASECHGVDELVLTRRMTRPAIAAPAADQAATMQHTQTLRILMGETGQFVIC
jgi:hypothetical protein